MDSRRRRTRSVLSFVGSAVLASLASGCAGQFGPGTLVVLEEGSGLICTPADEHGRAMFGVHHVKNESSSTVNLVDVELIEPDGLELLGVDLLPQDDPHANVVGGDYEIFGPEVFSDWIEIGGGEQRVAVFGVGLTAEQAGSTAGIKLLYSTFGMTTRGAAETAFTFQVVPFGQVC